ncbi:aspartyl/asparaginyl beta-hydroxylase domain-containing protein [Komagataeibacter intermedius]|nr:aspartyl/asparaginyl beta-hydroxylase domain-containing protein [Komagataeibacter intermedius]
MPCTAQFAAATPGLNSAVVSFLEPGARILLHNGVTKGRLTCHLGLQVPQDYKDCWIRIDDQILCWQHGNGMPSSRAERLIRSWQQQAGTE